jgi:hypothetical protein
MNIKPLFDRVVIKRMEEEKLSAGGIVIPDSATEKPIKGEVVAVGDGKVFDNGNVRAPEGQGRRQGPVRQVQRHRSEARRHRIPGGEGRRHLRRDRLIARRFQFFFLTEFSLR